MRLRRALFGAALTAFVLLFLVAVPYSACSSSKLIISVRNNSPHVSKLSTRERSDGNFGEWEDVVVLRPNEYRELTAMIGFNVAYCESIEIGVFQGGNLVTSQSIEASRLIKDGRNYVLHVEIRGQKLMTLPQAANYPQHLRFPVVKVLAAFYWH